MRLGDGHCRTRGRDHEIRGDGPDIFRELGRRVDWAILVKLDEDWLAAVVQAAVHSQRCTIGRGVHISVVDGYHLLALSICLLTSHNFHQK